jgi:signal transduction histidine kinase
MDEIKPNVLLVDDVEANLIALGALLSDLNCELIRAKSGNEALKHLLKHDFAVVLLDVQMPEMDGFEVARFARENPHTRDIPIVFLTAMHGSEESILRGYGSGAVDFLTKPINSYVLRSKVQVFIELYLSRRKLALEIAAHRRTLQALESANRALLHFTHAASHDLGAPLRSVRGFLGALSDATGDQLDEKARNYLQRARRASERMDALLGSLRSYARLQKPVAHAEVDCNAVLELVRTDLSELIEASHATLSAASLPTITGDRDRIYQLFLNLVGNALKYRKADELPQVALSVERDPQYWTFCVTDNGIGIDAAYSATVFNAFSRLNAQSVYEGTGLGLAICQQIVEQHGGTIWLESQLGRGSSFYFTLPCLAEATSDR